MRSRVGGGSSHSEDRLPPELECGVDCRGRVTGKEQSVVVSGMSPALSLPTRVPSDGFRANNLEPRVGREKEGFQVCGPKSQARNNGSWSGFFP